MPMVNDILLDAFGRVRESVHGVVDGLSGEQLAFRPDRESNSIVWLVWHLARVQDDHISGAAGTAQVWEADGWHERFGLLFDVSATGYGQTSEEVASVRVEGAELLTGYFDAVHERTIAYVRGLGEGDLEAVIDDSWDPPVTLATRLVSVVNDCTQHVGQAAYVRGLGTRAEENGAR